MYSKIFFAIALVCVTNASVLNAAADDPETEMASDPKRCDLQSCERLCRRLKFPVGACVNGRCKCDNFLNAEDDTGTGATAGLIRCKTKTCDWVCRRLNKTSGWCVDGRCNCKHSPNPEKITTDQESMLSLTEDDHETKVARIPKRCDLQSCERLCRRLKYPGGACVNGRCKCDNFLNAEADADSENLFSNLEDSVAPRKCTHAACNALCRKLKFREGVCIAGRCSCNNYFPKPKDAMNDLDESVSLDENFLSDSVPNAEDDVSEESLPVLELSEDPTTRGCNMRACHQLCHRLKFPGGACVNGRCKCDLFFGAEEDAVDEYSELDKKRICKPLKCYRTCSRRGYEGATCFEDRCKCYNISKSSLPISELSEDPTGRDCNTEECDKLCRRLNFPGGSCFNGRCRCDDFFGAEDAVDEYSESVTSRVCSMRDCNRTCTLRGYESSRCMNGWCICRNKIQREDTSPLNDVTSDGNGESYEEELTAPGSQACNTVNCNQMCRRLNYAGGWCRSGQCQCY